MGTINNSNSNLTEVPYINEIAPANAPLAIFTDNNSRILCDENGETVSYWLRTPIQSSWIHTINYDGVIYAWQNPASYTDNSDNKKFVHVRPMLSI